MGQTAITATADLAADCVAQMERFRQELVNDPTPCLSLFRRAIFHRDPDAWEALITVYRPHVQRWVRRRGFATNAGLVDELTQEALVRFWRAYSPEQLARARSLADILRYWQDCATCACLDWVRRGRHVPDSLDEAEDGPYRTSQTTDTLQRDVIQAEARDRIWQLVTEQCLDEADRILAHRVFVEGQKPRAVLQEHPELFDSIEHVYKRLRNLKDRLRRTPNLLALLETCG